MTRLVVLISGTGRNLQAILDALHAGRLHGEVCAVISNNPDAAGLAHARAAGVATAVVNHRDYPDRGTFDTALSAVIDRHAPDFIALAGFMRILGSEFVQRYRGRLLNIHPSLLPKYPGLQTHARAMAEGEAWHGASVHFVTEAVDGGPVILQGRVPVQGNDTVESLAERVMREVEQVIYPEALAWASAGRLHMRGDDVMLDGRVLTEPLLLKGSEMEMKQR
ncbi:MAG: phosphoribosylglycinamide formyltransferase [Nevskiales bacterium]